MEQFLEEYLKDFPKKLLKFVWIADENFKGSFREIVEDIQLFLFSEELLQESLRKFLKIIIGVNSRGIVGPKLLRESPHDLLICKLLEESSKERKTNTFLKDSWGKFREDFMRNFWGNPRTNFRGNFVLDRIPRAPQRPIFARTHEFMHSYFII